jgi:hypothetical protein
MRTPLVLVFIAGVLVTLFAPEGIPSEPINPGPQEEAKLWSAASIMPPVFDPYTFNIKCPEIHLGLVNDGTQVLGSGLRESVLIVNGQPLRSEKWDSELKHCLRGDKWEKLQPGDHTVVVCSLHGMFKEPGVYRVSWKGKNFQSPEALLRIIPLKPAAPKETKGKLWAVGSVVPPVIVMDRPGVSRSMLLLELTNEGKETVDTGADDSVLVINDQPLKGRDWDMALQNGLRSDNWTRLPPGVSTGKGIGSWANFITQPGIYRLSWRGKTFESPEILFRIMPAKAK